MNQVTEALTDWSQEDARGQSLELVLRFGEESECRDVMADLRGVLEARRTLELQGQHRRAAPAAPSPSTAPQSSTVHSNWGEILDAAKRSADITRQLLAFSRQQHAEPKILDLNDTIARMLKMLHRLIGEDVDLSWSPASISDG